MSSFQLSRLFGGQLTKLSIVTSAPLSFLLLGLQAMMDMKFSCPCMVPWNHGMSALIFFAPAISALVIMLLLIRPCKNKNKCSYRQDQTNRGKSQGEDNRGTSQGEDNRGTSQGEDNGRTSQGEDNRGTSQGENNGGTSQREDNRGTSQRENNGRTSHSEKNDLVENLDCCKAFLVCTIPCLVWICIFFIDGDYLACGFTTWNGHYACDKELHPNCLNWCKPNEMSQGKPETEYERTRELIRISKITGYVLAIIFCIIAIILVSCDCCKREISTCCGPTDPESQSHRQQGPGTENQQRNENASENERLTCCTQT